jgi:thioredoxin 1
MKGFFAPLAVIAFGFALAAAGDDAAKISPTAPPATARLPKMIDLGSKNCIPCRKMAPILDSLRAEYAGRAEIVFIDTREDRGASAQYRITLIPTQIFFDTLGAEVFRHVGFYPADSITARLEALGARP